MENNVKTFFNNLKKELKYSGITKTNAVIQLYIEKYEIEGPTFLDNVKSPKEIAKEMMGQPINKTKADQGVSIIGKIFFYLFFWIHIDITIGITVSSMIFTFLMVGTFSGLGFSAMSIIVAAFGNEWGVHVILKVMLGIMSSPLVFLVFVYLAYMTYNLVIKIYELSSQVFWKKDILLRSTKIDEFYNKIMSNKLVLYVSISAFGIAMILAPIIGFGYGWHQFNNSF